MALQIRVLLTSLILFLLYFLVVFIQPCSAAKASTQTRQVALTDVTGPGTGYLNDLNAVATGDVTYGDKAELLDVDFAETTRQAGVLTKLAVKLAANAVGLGPWAEFALQAGVDSAISGEIDVEAITKDAAFKYASAELSAYTKAELGIPAPAEGQYFGGDFLQNTAVDATVNTFTQTAIYGGSFSENLTDAYETALITEVTALGQNFVGDIKGFEGSPIGLIGHGVVGCLSSDLSGGDCGQGAVNAATGELLTAWADNAYGGDTDKVKELIRNKVNPTLAALTSGGDLGQFSINQGIADSQLENNYLSEHQWARRQKELDACDSLGCEIKVRLRWAGISTGQDASFSAGLVVGGSASIYETGEDFLALVRDPGTAYANLKELVTRDDALANLSQEIKQQYIDRINYLEAEYQRAGAGGSFYAGVEAGKLAIEIGSLAVGGVGVIKGGAGLTAKAMKAGTKIDVPPAPKGAGNAIDASTPVGRRTGFDDTSPDGPQPNGSGQSNPQMQVPSPTNAPAFINGRSYSGHALDRMQGRGLTPTVIDNTIKPKNIVETVDGVTTYVDSVNNVTAVVNDVTGNVITVY